MNAPLETPLKENRISYVKKHQLQMFELISWNNNFLDWITKDYKFNIEKEMWWFVICNSKHGMIFCSLIKILFSQIQSIKLKSNRYNLWPCLSNKYFKSNNCYTCSVVKVCAAKCNEDLADDDNDNSNQSRVNDSC